MKKVMFAQEKSHSNVECKEGWKFLIIEDEEEVPQITKRKYQGLCSTQKRFGVCYPYARCYTGLNFSYNINSNF
ncbi:MAG TPA: hypothetical protein EYO73_08185 [Sulfurimonas sp.]|nr:hypothetical protein [Sulfurimonas sp.]